MVAEAESAADDERRRECHRHVGDFTLFWTGVYPEALGKLQASDSPDHLINFQQQGKRSYYLASTLERGDEAPVLRRLSDEFELCAFGLSRVRREWEKLETDPPPSGTVPPPGRALAGQAEMRSPSTAGCHVRERNIPGRSLVTILRCVWHFCSRGLQ